MSTIEFKLNFKLVLAALSGITIGLMFTNFTPAQHRRPASIGAFGKHDKTMDIGIVSAEQGEILTLKGEANLKNTLNNVLYYEWIVPEGVEILDGEKNGVFAEAQVSRNLSTDIQVKNFNQGQILLRVYQVESDGSKIGEVSLVNAEEVKAE